VAGTAFMYWSSFCEARSRDHLWNPCLLSMDSLLSKPIAAFTSGVSFKIVTHLTLSQLVLVSKMNTRTRHMTPAYVGPYTTNSSPSMEKESRML
jgi:hypothetical protein